jgi:hypothetical protein
MSPSHDNAPPAARYGATAGADGLTVQVARQYLRLAVAGTGREYPNVPQ